jgi:fucose 4-O-acetylase-like acetyltransferase
MPVFFVMAGFFFGLLTDRRGVVGALANRAKRILVPFVLGWLAMAPLIIATVGYLKNRSWADALSFAMDGKTYWKYGALHLWFLDTCFCFTL